MADLNDPRGRHGCQYPMVGLLTLCLVAVLAGRTGPEAIAQFGRLRQKRLGQPRRAGARCPERRTMTTTMWLNGYLSNWPGLAQVFRLERRREVKGYVGLEVVRGITSLSSLAADAGMLLGYARALGN